MCFKTLFFDLDDTLYPPTSGIWEAIGDRMVDYMISKLNFPEAAAPAERERLFRTHGTTLRGLVAEYHVDDVDFLEYVHDIPLEQYISKNIALRKVLEQYPQRKIIFTNADTGHANRVLGTLGLEGLFDQIIDIRSIKPWCKPQTEAFTRAIELAGLNDATQCVMIDDAHRNLVTAHNLGLYTIHVGTEEIVEPVDSAILSLEDLPKVLPL